MRSTCALYIDAGYLLASAATRVTGTSLRSGIHVDYSTLISSLVDTAQDRSGLPVLRVYWYDSARNGIPDAQQERIGELSKVKLRLGRFGVNGEQKGVDLRIGLDLVTHARNGASDVFFLVSGDDDLTEAVEEAQVHGVQVVLLAVPTAVGTSHGVS
ncbi:NYN domain-containing protein, partial [Rhodococcus chondri]